MAPPFTMRLSIALLAIALAACSDRTDDLADDGPPMESEDSGTSEGSTDEALQMLCETGCARYQTCAPDQLASFHGSIEACEASCYDIYSDPACRDVAEPYAICTANLPCEDWPDLLDDPATSACAEPWADVMAVCDFG